MIFGTMKNCAKCGIQSSEASYCSDHPPINDTRSHGAYSGRRKECWWEITSDARPGWIALKFTLYRMSRSCDFGAQRWRLVGHARWGPQSAARAGVSDQSYNLYLPLKIGDVAIGARDILSGIITISAEPQICDNLTENNRRIKTLFYRVSNPN